jgi:rod shape determining protein RodA
MGIVTMRSFSVENFFFDRQIVWLGVALITCFLTFCMDFHPLRRTSVVTTLFIISITALALIPVLGAIVKGGQNRFDLGLFALQPADIAKLVMIIVLAKYFARRHVEIGHIKHILVSGMYVFVPFALIVLQPDFGSAIVLFCIWLGMVLVAGISWKHLAVFFSVALIAGVGMWTYALKPYQKARIETFVHPLTDIHGKGYNAYQSTIAVGSGQYFGKGVGYGTQSKLQFLPEFQTDFIFASFAEEWGFFGVVLLLVLFFTLIIRILLSAQLLTDNFEVLFATGVALYFMAQTTVHVGMDMGLLPITGTTLPFMSYGGSHLVVEYAALGIILSMASRSRPTITVRDETDVLGARI